MEVIIESLFFFLPAFFANAGAALSSKIPYIKSWETPVDMGKMWNGRRILGDHKTFRGVVVGFGMSGFAALIQYGIAEKGVIQFAGPLYSDWMQVLTLALAMGCGALVGDMVKSFLKRRARIAPGEPWLPFDWLDYVAGGLLFAWPIYSPDLPLVLNLVIFVPVIHVLSNIVSKLLGIKDRYF